MQPGMWRKGDGSEPDIVCTYNEDFSFEIKTSCAKGNTISGNRVQARSRHRRSAVAREQAPRDVAQHGRVSIASGANAVNVGCKKMSCHE